MYKCSYLKYLFIVIPAALPENICMSGYTAKTR
ncbi:hypothetical protein NXV15_24000 [Bacteroides thetaiotaomicron]|nr:hypothetical protein [Bacteroides thetaiotaomicron]MCS2687406.1 hypothetical protein [Bacteroides thetaiotaomicron]